MNPVLAAGRPAITTANKADAILRLSGTSNGRLAVEGFRELEKRTGNGSRTWPRARGQATSPSPTPRRGRYR